MGVQQRASSDVNEKAQFSGAGSFHDSEVGPFQNGNKPRSQGMLYSLALLGLVLVGATAFHTFSATNESWRRLDYNEIPARGDSKFSKESPDRGTGLGLVDSDPVPDPGDLIQKPGNAPVAAVPVDGFGELRAKREDTGDDFWIADYTSESGTSHLGTFSLDLADETFTYTGTEMLSSHMFGSTASFPPMMTLEIPESDTLSTTTDSIESSVTIFSEMTMTVSAISAPTLAPESSISAPTLAPEFSISAPDHSIISSGEEDGFSTSVVIALPDEKTGQGSREATSTAEGPDKETKTSSTDTDAPLITIELPDDSTATITASLGSETTTSILEQDDFPRKALEAVISAPDRFGGCEKSTVKLDGSYSGNGQPDLQHTWTLLDGDQDAGSLAAKLQLANTANLAIVELMEEDFRLGVPTDIQLKVYNGKEEATFTKTLTRENKIIPSLSLRGSTSRTAVMGRAIVIASNPTIPSCQELVGSNLLVFQWTISELRGSEGSETNNGISLPSDVATNRPELVVPANTLETGNYVATVTVYREADSEDQSLHVTASASIEVIRGPIVAGIEGGSRSEGIGRDIVLNAGFPFTYDSDSPASNSGAVAFTYKWSCTEIGDQPVQDSGTSGCFTGQLTGSSVTVHSAAAGATRKLAEDRRYRFTVQVTDPTRTATATVDIHTLPGSPPSVTVLKTYPSGVYAQSQLGLVLEASVKNLDDPNAAITVSWATVDGAGYGILDLSDSEVVAVSSDPRQLIIKPGKLIADDTSSKYKFQVSLQAESGSATATLDVLVNRAPFGGALTAVSNATGTSSGTAYQDMWTVSASGWLDDQVDSDLRYGFSTIDSNGVETVKGFPSVRPTANFLLGGSVEEVCVTVTDFYLAAGVACIPINVFVPEQTASERSQLAKRLIENDIEKLARDGDVGGALATVSSVIELVSASGTQDSTDVGELVQQQVQALNVVTNLIQGSGVIAQTVAVAAISTVGKLDADKLPSADLGNALDLMTTLIDATTRPPAFSASVEVSMEPSTARIIGAFLSKALQNSGSTSSALSARIYVAGDLARRQSDTALEDKVLRIIDNASIALVNGIPCDVNGPPKEISSDSFTLKTNKLTPDDSRLPQSLREVSVGSFISTIPIGVRDCVTVAVVDFRTAVKDASASRFNITTDVMSTKFLDTTTAANRNPAGETILYSVSGNFSQSEGSKGRCVSYAGSGWTHESCSTTQLNDSELQCECEFEHSYFAAQMVASTSPPAYNGPNVAAIVGGTVGGVVLVAIAIGGVVFLRRRRSSQ